MINSRDLALFAVVFASVGLGVIVPDSGRPFQPYLLYLMMFLLFLSFLRIDFSAFVNVSGPGLLRLGGLTATKLIVLPGAMYLVFSYALPDYAVPVLLLSGISTGVVAPFIGNLLGASMPRVLQMVVCTSVLVPFSLPFMVKVMAGEEIAIPLSVMMQLLVMVILIPMLAVLIARRLCPGLLQKIMAVQYPVSLALFAMINLGVFCRYSSFFFEQPGQLLVAVGVAYVLSAIYHAVGFLMAAGRDVPQRLASAVSMAVVNNVLVVVFSSQFFGPLSPTLAAMYMFPFFTMIVPVKLLVNRCLQPGTEGSERN